MPHHAVEVGGAERPCGAEGARVDPVGEVAVILAGLQPPQNLASLGVPGLIVGTDSLLSSCNTNILVDSNGDGTNSSAR